MINEMQKSVNDICPEQLVQFDYKAEYDREFVA